MWTCTYIVYSIAMHTEMKALYYRTKSKIYFYCFYRNFSLLWFFLIMPHCVKSARPYSELFWSAFSRIRTEYREISSISPYSLRMRENADQHNSEYGHFSRSATITIITNYTAEYILVRKHFEGPPFDACHK